MTIKVLRLTLALVSAFVVAACGKPPAQRQLPERTGQFAGEWDFWKLNGEQHGHSGALQIDGGHIYLEGCGDLDGYVTKDAPPRFAGSGLRYRCSEDDHQTQVKVLAIIDARPLVSVRPAGNDCFEPTRCCRDEELVLRAAQDEAVFCRFQFGTE